MGVLRCVRYYCNNILCDRHSYEYGYLCNDCFEELVDLGINVNIEKFLQTSPGSNENKKNKSYEKWSKIFPSRSLNEDL